MSDLDNKWLHDKQARLKKPTNKIKTRRMMSKPGRVVISKKVLRKLIRVGLVACDWEIGNAIGVDAPGADKTARKWQEIQEWLIDLKSKLKNQTIT